MSERQNWLAANIDQMNDEYWRVVGERDAERAYAEAIAGPARILLRLVLAEAADEGRPIINSNWLKVIDDLKAALSTGESRVLGSPVLGDPPGQGSAMSTPPHSTWPLLWHCANGHANDTMPRCSTCGTDVGYADPAPPPSSEFEIVSIDQRTGGGAAREPTHCGPNGSSPAGSGVTQSGTSGAVVSSTNAVLAVGNLRDEPQYLIAYGGDGGDSRVVAESELLEAYLEVVAGNDAELRKQCTERFNDEGEWEIVGTLPGYIRYVYHESFEDGWLRVIRILEHPYQQTIPSQCNAEVKP